MQAGARGYVLKDAEGEETLRAMRVAAGGEAIFSPTIAQRLADYFAAPAKGSATPTEQAHREQQETPVSEYPAGLTAREVEVLKLVAEGLTNAQIADSLYLSPHRSQTPQLDLPQAKDQLTRRCSPLRRRTRPHLSLSARS